MTAANTVFVDYLGWGKTQIWAAAAPRPFPVATCLNHTQKEITDEDYNVKQCLLGER